MYGWDITEDDLKVLRLDAVKADFLAESMSTAYYEALCSFWHQKVSAAIGGSFGPDYPREAIALFEHSGRISVQVFRIKATKYTNGALVCYSRKNKDGKWGKSIYECSANLFARNAQPKNS